MAEDDGERRRVPRAPVTAAVDLTSAVGYTRDVSSTGVFIETDRAYPLGTRLRFILAFSEFVGGPRRAQCEGEVVRVEQQGDRVGLGVRILSHEWLVEAERAD